MFMMSGDLGNAGLPQEILRLVGPHYQLKVHGPMTGLNLVRACSMLGATERGLALLDEIDAIGLPDVTAQAAELRKAFQA